MVPIIASRPGAVRHRRPGCSSNCENSASDRVRALRIQPFRARRHHPRPRRSGRHCRRCSPPCRPATGRSWSTTAPPTAPAISPGPPAPRVVHEPTPGLRRRPAGPASLAADPPDGVVCFMDGDGSLDPGDLPAVAGPVLAGRADLVLGARRPTTAAAWPLPRPGGQPPCWPSSCAAGRAGGCPTSARCGPPAATPCWPSAPGPALRLAAGDGAAGGGRRLAHRRGRRPLRRPGPGASKVTGTRAGHGPGDPGHGPAPRMNRCRSRAPHVLVMAKEPRPGRVKTRLCPPCTAGGGGGGGRSGAGRHPGRRRRLRRPPARSSPSTANPARGCRRASRSSPSGAPTSTSA